MLAQMKVHNDKFMAAFTNQDPESIGPLYTSDCKVMPTGQDVIEGRKGIMMLQLKLLYNVMHPFICALLHVYVVASMVTLFTCSYHTCPDALCTIQHGP